MCYCNGSNYLNTGTEYGLLASEFFKSGIVRDQTNNYKLSRNNPLYIFNTEVAGSNNPQNTLHFFNTKPSVFSTTHRYETLSQLQDTPSHHNKINPNARHSIFWLYQWSRIPKHKETNTITRKKWASPPLAKTVGPSTEDAILSLFIYRDHLSRSLPIP